MSKNILFRTSFYIFLFLFFTYYTNVYASSNLLDAYDYNSSSCIYGTESTCQKNTCYEKSDSSCQSGTIIKYQVNSNTIKYFNVISDDGEYLVMQSIDDTVSNVAWYTDDSLIPKNTYGPISVLPRLEEATSGWLNVEDISYTMGTTVFLGNAYTGCSDYSTCNTNQYTLDNRVAKARMITVQEAAALGCSSSASSCPLWMKTNVVGYTGYWTMNAVSGNTQNNYAWYVSSGYLHQKTNEQDNSAARAVVKVKKNISQNNNTQPENSNSDMNDNNTNNINSNSARGENVKVGNTAASKLIITIVGLLIIALGGSILFVIYLQDKTKKNHLF